MSNEQGVGDERGRGLEDSASLHPANTDQLVSTRHTIEAIRQLVRVRWDDGQLDEALLRGIEVLLQRTEETGHYHDEGAALFASLFTDDDAPLNLSPVIA